MLTPAATTQLAILCLVALAALALVAFVIWWRRSPLTLTQTLMWSVNYLITRLLWGTRIEGTVQVSSGQGAIIVANHRSSIDPSFVQICVRRVVYWMVAREYCEAPIIGGLLRAFQVIPVGRGGIDTAATKLAIRRAQEGGLVGMFPEGRINETEQLLLPGRPGAALVALRARVPIIPVFITGSPYDGTPVGPLFMPAKVRVKIGKAIDLSEYFGREKEEGVTWEITKRVMREMARLAGDSDFEPQLAGRRWKPGNDEEVAASLNGHNGEAIGSPRQATPAN